MKKFLLKISVFVLYAFLIQVVLPVTVDPFHVFRTEGAGNSKVSYNGNYIKMKYILNNPDKFDSFIFGSSRVGAIHPEKMPGRTYNMWYSGGYPAEHAANIRTFLQNNVRPSKIFMGVDSTSYTQSAEPRIIQPAICPYEYLRDNPAYFYALYLNPMDTIRALWTMFFSPGQVLGDEIFFSYGYGIDYNLNINYIWKDDKDITPEEYQQLTGVSMNMEQTFASIKEIADMCRENGVELVVFTNPLHRLTYIASVKKRYFDFLEGLAEISDFWNFSSLNDITLNNDNYCEHSHYRAEVGDMIVNAMCYGKSYPELQRQGFGVKVTRENAKDFISMLRKQLEDYEKSHK